MPTQFTRRYFLAATSVLAAVRFPASAAEVPPMLDHVLLGTNNLDTGIAEIEQKSGVRAAGGGSHPGAGTWNALLSLGTERYLEIIAPDPKQKGVPANRYGELAGLTKPRLITWAAHTRDIDAVAQRLRDAGIAANGPNDGSRVRPDGKTLHWRTLALKDNKNGLLPFFIQWGADSIHPSVDAPHGCQLVSFEVVSPEADSLRDLFQKTDVEVQVRAGAAQLRAHIQSPRGEFELIS